MLVSAIQHCKSVIYIYIHIYIYIYIYNILLSLPLPPYPTPLLFSHSVVSDSLQPRGLQQARHLCLLEFESMMPSNHLILCCLLLVLLSMFPNIRVFSNASALHIRWPRYWNFSISPSNKYSGLVSFKIDWFDPFAVQGSLKNLLQHHNSKASVLWCLAFLTVQLSHPYMATGKAIALTIQTFVGKVMSLYFNMLSRFVIAYITRSKCLLISWLQFHHSQWFWSPRK